MEPLRILMVEDNPADAELILRNLDKAGLDPQWKRVETEDDFLAELKPELDIILSDHSLPTFSGPRALELLNETGLDIPFIIISGTIGEEIAVTAMRLGAADYLLKDRLARLPQAVTQAIQQRRARRQAEETRRTLEAQLRQAQKMEAIGTLAGGVAHDFNNILSAILGNVELARLENPPGPITANCLHEIKRAGIRAKDLVRQILSFSREQSAERAIISLGPVVEEVVALMRATLPAGIRIEASITEDTPKVLADSTQIHQVLVNLCTNAWHAMEESGGKIEIALLPVRLSAEEAQQLSGLRPGIYSRIIVRDTGKGMDKETLEQIFDPFFTTKAPDKGTGLGLSVVHGIMQSHDGAIRVESAPGQGTSFYLCFPAVEAAIEKEEPAVSEVQSGGGQHILFIDDEKPLVFIASRVLKHLRYQVTGFTSPEEAIVEFQNNPGKYDAVITDMNMPGSSGLKVAEEIRKISGNVPIILTSGYITENLSSKAKRIGVTEMLYKPTPLEDLSAMLGKLFARP